MEPTPSGLIDHVTAWLTELVTVAVICALWPLFSVVVPELTLTAMGGSNVIVIDEDAVGSARLVAATVVVCAVVMAGAV